MHWDVDADKQAEMLANRVAKNLRRLKPRFARDNINAFRLYDRDIPEIRVAIDWYAGQLVVAEYQRAQHEAIPGWVQRMADAVARKLGVTAEHVHIKLRRTRPQQGPRYRRLQRSEQRHIVQEGALRFWVSLRDYLDTGLFLDQRITRRQIRSACADKRILNLYAYTGAFTCAAALGGASQTVSVDRSGTYLRWARDNLELNGLDHASHQLVCEDTGAYLERAAAQRERFDMILLDPPTYSTAGQDSALDIQRDHRALIERCLGLLSAHGTLLFSTNHQRFEPELADLPEYDARECTAETVPEDFRNRQIHRSFRIERQRVAP